MSAPLAITRHPPGLRTPCLYDLESSLVAYLTRLFDAERLDNPQVNELQPDIVPFDEAERMQALEGKAPPRIFRGRVPRGVAGEIDPSKLPKAPAIIVQAISGKIDTTDNIVTTHILASAYDESQESVAYQDCQNMVEAMVNAFGQRTLERTYPIVLPMEWKLIEMEFYAIGELTVMWRLPSVVAQPNEFEGLPAEAIGLRLETGT